MPTKSSVVTRPGLLSGFEACRLGAGSSSTLVEAGLG